MPVLQIEHEKEYSSDNTGYTMVNFNLTRRCGVHQSVLKLNTQKRKACNTQLF